MTTDLHLFEPLEHILQGRVVLQPDGLALGTLHHLEILHLGSSVSYDVIQNHLCQNVSISLNLGTQRDLYPVLYIFWVCCTFLRKQTKQHLHLKDAVPRSKSKLHVKKWYKHVDNIKCKSWFKLKRAGMIYWKIWVKLIK